MTIDDKLTSGIHAQRAGNLDAAEAVYRGILASEPEHPDALHLLGVILHQRKRSAEGAVFILRAISAAPNCADFHANLGIVLRAQGELTSAEASFQRALQLNPDHVEAHNNLGIALRSQGKLTAAIACLQRALQLKPDHAEAHNNLGNALKEQGKLDEAVASYQHVLRLKPDLADAHNNLAAVRKEQGKLDEAIAGWQSAVQINPDFAEAHNNLGKALKSLERLDEALASIHRALELAPDCADAHLNLGSVLADQGKLQQAITSYRRALSLEPDSAEAHMSCGMAQLTLGDFQQGWAEYEWRVKTEKATSREFAQPRWDGACVPDKALLIHTEQGLGDTLQFIRFATLARQRVGRVVVLCQEVLRPLLSSVAGVDALVTEADDLPEFDFHLPLLSFPAVFCTQPETIPAQVPYLTADRSLVQRWRSRLKGLNGFRVGISWQGNPEYRLDRVRSMPLLHFARLAELQPVQLISLQKGPGVDQIERVRGQFEVFEPGAEFDESSGAFVDSAAVMQNLDLFVTSDTAAAHLAGALGITVWVALPIVPDWRWQLDRTDCPWYPTMRLFRQRQRGDWDDVFQRMRDALRDRIT